ncbi:Centrosomal protein of 135 kDa [Triplophysa tibetana]|uniref:Centrosomal protein of 135 kDa n=1 Tax=Triplophysa tibetana TaxID=1572043 RepID=A0A5A9NF73_9TELE|nr:Centrosomal protein of 135 kDa [Triplophysa tibetana]
MAMTTSAERKFINLRKRLDQLGYRQPLAIECLPLVEKLFSDLVHTTESLRNAKLAAGKTEKDSRNLDTILEPYKTDNARLVKENNELHLGLLKVKEEKDRISRELKAYIRKLEHETTDLKFLNNQYVHKVRSLEKDSKAKTERIFQLQEKNMQAVVQTPGGKKRSIPFRRQRMQTDELLPPSGPAPSSVAQPVDPYIADLLQVADDRIQELQNEVAQLMLDLERAQAGIKHLNNQVEERDKEIERLNRALDGGRPNDVISLEAQNISNEKLIAHLNLQIEYLQETNRSLEEKVEGLQQRKKTVSSEVADLSARNQELCQELTQVDQLAQQLEKDKEMVLETADMELLEAKKEIQRQLREIGNLEEVISTLRRHMADGDHEKDRLRDQLLELQEQNEKMEGLMNFLEEEKKRLHDKTERMTQADKEMILELERMRVKHGVCGKDPSPSRLDAFVKSLEEERDYYRQEVERYRTVKGRGNRSPSSSPGRGRSPRGRNSWHAQRDYADVELSRAVKERDELQSVLLGFEKHMEDIQTRVKLLTAERDQLSTQYQQAQEELRRVYMELESPDFQSRIGDDRTQTEIQRITAERDRLRDRLKGAQTTALTDREQEEIRILELENTVQMLEREKADLRTQVSVLKENRAAFEKELQARSTIMVENAEEAVQQRAESCALRLLQEQMEQSLSDVQHRLSVKTNELQAAHQQIDKLEEKIGVCLYHSVLFLVLSTITVLQYQLNLVDMEESHRKLILPCRKRLYWIRSHEELSSISRDREVALRENRRLQDDLATMTRENQAVHAEMQDALNERDELKLRVHSYISEVARIESLMAAKEQENREMLKHFRSIHSESEDMELKLQQAEELNKSIRLELLSSDTERRHLRERVSLQDREIQEHLNATQAYESQVSSLAREMSHLEEEVQTAQAEKASVLEDLASIRELCVKLDSSKEVTARQLTAKSMELERVTGELEDVHSEVENMKKQLVSERLTVRNLETLLSTNRQKEFQTHLSASEKESELKVLRDRLALADSKTAGHAREVSQLRGKVSQLQTEMDVLKRQLTTERFERERAVQEMRRQGLSFSSLRSSSPLSTSLSPRPVSPERSILRTPEHSIDKIPEKSTSF